MTTRLRRLCFTILLLSGAVGVGLRAADSSAPVRVLSQTVGTDELLLALAEPGQIAALSHLATNTSFSAVSKEAEKYDRLPANGDAESAFKFRPTLVLCADYSRADLVSQIRRSGVRVLIFDRYKTLEDAFFNLRLLAKELGAEAKAEALIADCQRRVTELQHKLAGQRPVRVIAPSTYGVIPGSDTTFQDLCDHACADNLAASLAGMKGHVAPPTERMLGWPIEKVVLTGANPEKALATYRALPPYQFMPVIKEGRVALISPHLLSCVSHLRVDGYEQLARALHPELFTPKP